MMQRQFKSAGTRRFLKRREQTWDNYAKPISKYNEAVHHNAKIPFDRV
jgi:hypothetical protein